MGPLKNVVRTMMVKGSENLSMIFIVTIGYISYARLNWSPKRGGIPVHSSKGPNSKNQSRFSDLMTQNVDL